MIVVARGGGSLEDLLPFSSEALVRAAAECVTPLVSAIGHEKDAPLLDLVADLMFRHSSLKLMIFGHTCDIGSEQYNLWLSQKRAEAVKNYLAQVGVLGEYVKAKGYGESRPITSNDTEEGRKKNRRVEFVLTTRWWHSIF